MLKLIQLLEMLLGMGSIDNFVQQMTPLLYF